MSESDSNLILKLRPLQLMIFKMMLIHKRIVVILPRQEGKTELGVHINKHMLTSPSVRARQTFLLGKSKKSLPRIAREKFHRIFGAKEFKINSEIVHKKGSPATACFLDSVDKDPDKIRGGSPDYVHWTEMAFARLEKGVTIADIWGKVVQPSMRETNGFFYGETTLNGKNTFFDFCEDSSSYGVKVIRLPLSLLVEMGIRTEAEYFKIKNSTPELIFRQEYECEWITFQSLMYPEFTESLVTTVDTISSYQTLLMGLDWGYNDATCVLFAYVLNGTIYIFKELYGVEWTLDYTESKVSEILKDLNFKNYVIAADHDKLANKELERRGLNAIAADKADVLGCRMEIKTLFHNRRIVIDKSCKYLIRDIEAAMWDKKKLNELDESQSTWGHFDAEAALRYLIRQCLELEEQELKPHPFMHGRNFAHSDTTEQYDTLMLKSLEEFNL